MENIELQRESLLRIKGAIEEELDNLGWHWSPLLSSLVDQIQNRIDELRQSEEAKKLERRKMVLRAQGLCLQLEECLKNLAVAGG
jgi:hypothetical protein